MGNNETEEVGKELEERRRKLKERMLQIEEDDLYLRKAAKPCAGARAISRNVIDLVLVAMREKELPMEFVQFVALWESFNCWLRTPVQCQKPVASRARDTDLVNSFACDPEVNNLFKKLLGVPDDYKGALERLQKLCPVYEVRGGARTQKKVEITDTTDLTQIMDVVYQIRCNLFHGSKGLDDERDRNLVAVAAEVLLPLLLKVFEDPEITYLPRGGQ